MGNLGTGMRASVHVDLPGWTKESVDKLKARCEELAVQPRGTRGESGGQTGHTYDISNKHRLGYSEVQLVQVMIDAVNTLWKEDLELQEARHVNQQQLALVDKIDISLTNDSLGLVVLDFIAQIVKKKFGRFLFKSLFTLK